jgi:hypothetical protein
MDPAIIGVFIPVLALSIPIVAIISSGRTKRAELMARTKGGPEVERLERRVAELEDQVHALSHTMLSLEQQQEFTSRLLEENSGHVTQ